MLQTQLHIKKHDMIQIMVGREKGKTGKVLKVQPKKGTVLIEKLNMIKRHTKSTGKTPGGIIEKEGPILACKVLLYCEKCGRGVRTRNKAQDSGKKVRTCVKCDTQLEK